MAPQDLHDYDDVAENYDLYLAEHGIFADGTDLSEAMCRFQKTM